MWAISRYTAPVGRVSDSSTTTSVPIHEGPTGPSPNAATTDANGRAATTGRW